MTKQTGKKKTTRRQHAPEFRAEALALAAKIGVSKAAKEHGFNVDCYIVIELSGLRPLAVAA